MDQKISPRIWTIFGIGIAVIAGFGLLLAFLGHGPGISAPTIVPTTPTPSDDPVAASVNGRLIKYSFWREAVLLDQVMSGLAGQPAPAPDETLQRLINEELVLHAIPPDQIPTTEQTKAQITALEQSWGVDDAAVVTALEKVGLTRAAFEQTVWRLLVVQAGLETLQAEGYDTAAWLEEQRANAEIVLSEGLGNVVVPHIPIAQSPLATPITSPIPTPTPPSELASPIAATPVPATESPSPTPAMALPEIAPDFTLTGAKGITLILSEQLARGPVVLAFFQRGGG
jgi:hypothetical protein